MFSNLNATAVPNETENLLREPAPPILSNFSVLEPRNGIFSKTCGF